MLNEGDNPNLRDPVDGEPGLVRFSEAVTQTEDPGQAANFADLFLLCMASAGTVIGSLAGCGLYLGVFARQQVPTFSWMVSLLGSVALGGACGCATVMVIMHARDLIRWETQKKG